MGTGASLGGDLPRDGCLGPMEGGDKSFGANLVPSVLIADPMKGAAGRPWDLGSHKAPDLVDLFTVSWSVAWRGGSGRAARLRALGQGQRAPGARSVP